VGGDAIRQASLLRRRKAKSIAVAAAAAEDAAAIKEATTIIDLDDPSSYVKIEPLDVRLGVKSEHCTSTLGMRRCL
jgi:hypothetical protein